jgi:hypothetical protein
VGSSTVAFSFASGEWSITENITFPANIVLIPAIGASFAIASGITMTVNTPEKLVVPPRQQIVSGSGTLAFTSPGTVYVGWWGVDATGIGNAIDAANGGQLAWPTGSYSVATAISKTLTGEQEWATEGPVTCTWGGAANGTMISLELAGFDLTIKGPFIFDANNSANYPIAIDNSSATMAAAANLAMTDVKGINSYSTTATDNSGIYIEGGYDRVVLERCSASDCSRAAALGSVTTGIMVKYTDINAYPKQVSIIDVDIDTVTSLDDPPLADMDGLAVIGPDATDAPVPGAKQGTVLMTRGGRWTNCQGRSIKSLMESNIINSPTFIRNSAGKITRASAKEVDFLLGSGSVNNISCFYEPLSDASTPFGSLFAVVGAQTNNYSGEEGAVLVRGGQVVNDVPSATDLLPRFLWLSSLAEFHSVSASDITFLGEGRIDVFVRTTAFVTRSLRIYNNYFYDMSGGTLIYLIATGTNCDAYVVNNVNKSGTASLLFTELGVVAPMTGFGNFGFTEDTTGDASAATEGETFRATRIMPKETNEGGTIVTESAEVDDDDTYAFSQRNHTTGIGIYFISANEDDKAQGIFACDTNTQTDLTNGAATSIAYGNAANPDTDTKLNVWVSSNKINIKNRLGGTRIISLMSYG